MASSAMEIQDLFSTSIVSVALSRIPDEKYSRWSTRFFILPSLRTSSLSMNSCGSSCSSGNHFRSRLRSHSMHFLSPCSSHIATVDKEMSGGAFITNGPSTMTIPTRFAA